MADGSESGSGLVSFTQVWSGLLSFAQLKARAAKVKKRGPEKL
jgi:hypothetical protein